MKYVLNNYLKVSICAFICWLIPSSVWAGYDVEVDGIYYYINSDAKTAEVTFGSYEPNHYSGDLIIPESFVYQDETYRVTEINFCAFSYPHGYINDRLISVTIPNSVTSIGFGAFYRCTNLTTVTIGSGVNDIGMEDTCIFSGCPNLTSINIDVNNKTFDSRDNCNAIIETSTNTLISGCDNTIIPNSVTSIGRGAFSGCTGLTSVTIPNSVTSIGGGAFLGCSGLTSVTIPNSVTSIGDRAFSGTPWYDNQPDGLIYINNVAYAYKGEMPEGTEINLKSGTVSVSDYAFNGCTGLTSLTIPNSVTSIGGGAFENCTGLTSVTIPNSVTSIGSSAFYGCTGLTSITLEHETPISLSSSVFENVDKTTCILFVPYGCKSAYVNASGWSDFQNIVEPSVLVTGSCGDNVTYTIYSDMTMVISGTGAMWNYEDNYYWYNKPDRYGGYFSEIKNVIIEEGVTSIGNYAFYDFRCLSSLTIPNTVTSIGDLAISYCKELTSITIPNSVTRIGWGVFYGCSSLSSLFIPANVSIIKSGDSIYDLGSVDYGGIFCNCNALTTITVDVNNPYFDSRDGCNAIIETSSNNLIAGCPGTIIPNSVTTIADYAFFYCQGLTSITIPNSVTSIGGSAFSGCTGLTSVEIPNSVTSIGWSAFYGCTGLTSVTIPNNVTSIESSTFYGCTGLTSVTIPNSVTSIGGSAFSGTPWYDNQPDGLIYINNVAYAYKGEMPEGTEINLKSGTVSVSDYAFSGCTGLTSVTIPSSVTSIGDWAFNYCTGLTSVTIPNSVTSIGSYAFRSCTGLTSIFAESEMPVYIRSSVFYQVDKSACTLYVPKGCKSVYEDAVGWRDFEHIVEVEFDTDITTLDNAIYVEQTEGRIGGTKDISVKMKNDFDVRGFQFSMELPEGSTINSFTLNQDRMPAGITMNKVFSTENIDGNKINVVCVLNDGLKTFTGNDGAIATVNVSFAEDMEEGSYPIYLTDISISDASAEHQLELSDIKATLILEDYVLGDTNGDGKVLVGDVISILNYIVGFPSENFNAKAADVNGDGKVLVGDVIAVLNIIVNL